MLRTYPKAADGGIGTFKPTGLIDRPAKKRIPFDNQKIVKKAKKESLLVVTKKSVEYPTIALTSLIKNKKLNIAFDRNNDEEAIIALLLLS